MRVIYYSEGLTYPKFLDPLSVAVSLLGTHGLVWRLFYCIPFQCEFFVPAFFLLPLPALR